jgi:hypothetical protein
MRGKVCQKCQAGLLGEVGMHAMRKARVRAWLMAAVCGLALCPWAPTAMAQATEGAINGHAGSGQTVQATSLDTGRTRQVQAHADGSFSLTHLPPGRYRIEAGGAAQELVVTVGTTIHIKLADTNRVEVHGSAQRTAIDMSSTEDATVFTKDQLRALPVVRSVQAVALLAPGTVEGDAFSGGLPSFRGASVAENGYYINGFDVTNIRNFMSDRKSVV